MFDNFNSIKMENFHSSNDVINKMKRQVTICKKIFVTHITNQKRVCKHAYEQVRD